MFKVGDMVKIRNTSAGGKLQHGYPGFKGIKVGDTGVIVEIVDTRKCGYIVVVDGKHQAAFARSELAKQR